MRLLVLSTIWPHPSHTFQAANIILFELLSNLQKDCNVSLLKIDREFDARPEPHEIDGLNLLRGLGVTIAQPLQVTIKNRVSSFSEHFFPAARARESLEKAVRPRDFDAVFVPLSEYATMLSAALDVTKFAYYGNPDPKVRRARAELERIYGPRRSHARRLKGVIGDRFFERTHLSEMRRVDLVGNVAANDAKYYADAGHPRAFYVRNVWIRRHRKRPAISRHPTEIRIIANVGRLSSTANCLGLTYLADRVLPLMTRQLRRSFSIHLLGSGELFADLRLRLEQYPQVRIRGFVPDIDDELMNAHLFLCVNNATTFKVCHTRYLHAWSLGMCVIAHTDAALSIPEMRHGENALLGSTPQHLVDLIEEASDNPGLRRSIGEGGRETFTTQFTGESVAPHLVELLNEAV